MKSGKIIKFFLLLLAFAAVSAVAAFMTVHLLIKNQPVAIVPDLKNKEINYAVKALESLSLTPRIKHAEFSNVVPADYIIGQSPKPGETVKKGRDINLVLSRGKKQNIMPVLTGLSVERANDEIIKNGLILNHVSFMYDSDFEKNILLASSPEPGSYIHPGAKVDILVSLGRKKETYIMPDLSNMTIESASEEIKSRNMSISKIQTRYDPDFEENIILSQFPSPGTTVTEKDKVLLIINHKESQPVISPVIGSRIVSYTLPAGILRSHVIVKLNIYGREIDLYDDYYRPSEKIDILIPMDRDAIVSIIKDGSLVFEKNFQAFEKYDRSDIYSSYIDGQFNFFN